jgi:hypothetical protein
MDDFLDHENLPHLTHRLGRAEDAELGLVAYPNTGKIAKP